MSAYSHKSALDELRAKRPATRPQKQIPTRNSHHSTHLCWLPQNPAELRTNQPIDFNAFASLRATCSNNESLCNERIQRAAQRAHGDYAAQYQLERAS